MTDQQKIVADRLICDLYVSVSSYNSPPINQFTIIIVIFFRKRIRGQNLGKSPTGTRQQLVRLPNFSGGGEGGLVILL